MKQLFNILFFFSLATLCFAQQEYHVTTNGTSHGNGSLEKPWDLQTALNHPEQVADGDTIYLHGGIYDGRFKSKLQSSSANNKIIVSGYKNEMAVLNGNVDSPLEAVLTVTGKNVIYRNFSITPRGLKTRNQSDPGFKIFTGLYHTSGTNCEFLNLTINGNNGLGFGSWNRTGGSIIANCMIYDNGFINTKGKGIGEGMYVQNASENETRIIRNNIIFNNYYKGIEVWSAARRPERSYVKNVLIENNVIFNSGLVANRTVDNIIIATDDRNGINIAKNIKVNNNILFHDLDYATNNVNGDAPSLTLGFRSSAAVENIDIKDNIIFGKNNPVRILHAKSLNFSGNTIYGGYLQTEAINFTNNYFKDWQFKENDYFTKNSTPIRIIGDKKYNFNNWKSTYRLDQKSDWKSTNSLDLYGFIDISPNLYKSHSFRIVTFNKSDQQVVLDFSKYNIKSNTTYVIKDVTDLDKIYTEGNLNENQKISIKHPKSKNGFKVYVLEFNISGESKQTEKTFLERIFDRFGF